MTSETRVHLEYLKKLAAENSYELKELAKRAESLAQRAIQNRLKTDELFRRIGG